MQNLFAPSKAETYGILITFNLIQVLCIILYSPIVNYVNAFILFISMKTGLLCTTNKITKNLNIFPTKTAISLYKKTCTRQKGKILYTFSLSKKNTPRY